MDAPTAAARVPLRILVLTRSYPAAGDLYQYPFVHRRVLAYRAEGHDVAVFQPREGGATSHEFEGVVCHGGDSAAFMAFARNWKPDVIAAHGFSDTMWPTLKEADGVPVRAWLHGSEIPAIFRPRASEIRNPEERAAALKQVAARADFWREFLADGPHQFKLVFPSNAAVSLMREDCGDLLRSSNYEVIPNPIDTVFFGYSRKQPEDRFSILSIRPYECWTRANELAVQSILDLSKRSGFERFRFTFMGDGPLFEETLAPITDFSNVTIRRGFVTQQEIRREHARHGIFLVPTRLDTQGVSRDEAMASGLVPVTSAIPVVREFVDEDCAGLAAPDDANGLAEEIWRMAEDPKLFLRRSASAAGRIRDERSNALIIPAEVELLASAVHA